MTNCKQFLTAAGWVFGLTTEPMQKTSGPKAEPNVDDAMEAKIQQLKLGPKNIAVNIEPDSTSLRLI